MEICPCAHTIAFSTGEILLLCAHVPKRKDMRENTKGKGVVFFVEMKNISICLISKFIFFLSWHLQEKKHNLQLVSLIYISTVVLKASEFVNSILIKPKFM